MQDRRGEVDTQRKLIIGCADLLLVHPWIDDDQRHTDRLLVRVPLVRQAVLGVVVAVVRRKNHKRVVEHALLFELVEDDAAGRIDFRRHAVVVLHHPLELLGIVEAPVPTLAALVLVGEEVRQVLPALLGRVHRHGDLHVLIQLHRLGLWQKLVLMRILGVGREETDRQRKGFVFGCWSRNLSASYSLRFVTWTLPYSSV